MEGEVEKENKEERRRPLFKTDPFLVLVYISTLTIIVLAVEFFAEGETEYIRLQSKVAYAFLIIVVGRVILIRRWYHFYKEFFGYIYGVRYSSFPVVSFLNVSFDVYVVLLMYFWLDIESLHFVSVPVVPLVYLSFAAGNAILAALIRVFWT